MSDAIDTARQPVTALVVASALVGLMLAGSVVLWLHYGTTVFFEMIRTGFVACFG